MKIDRNEMAIILLALREKELSHVSDSNAIVNLMKKLQGTLEIEMEKKSDVD